MHLKNITQFFFHFVTTKVMVFELDSIFYSYHFDSSVSEDFSTGALVYYAFLHNYIYTQS